VRDPFPVPERLPPPLPGVVGAELPDDPAEAYRQVVPAPLRQGLSDLTGVSYESLEVDSRSAFVLRGGERESLQRLHHFAGSAAGDGSPETGGSSGGYPSCALSWASHTSFVLS
jgi:hypothetical protein